MSEALTATAPTRPWQAQPGESQAEHARFLLWAFGDRAAPLSSACTTAAAAWNWTQRCAVIDHLLNPSTETPQQAIGLVCADALVILRREVQWIATRQPGSVATRDVIALLKLASDLGLQAKKPDAAADDEPGTYIDWESMTPDDAVAIATLMGRYTRTRG